MGARITSNSWGGGRYSQAMVDALQATKALHIFAAGNDSNDNDRDPAFPASYDLDNIVSVAATNSADEIAYFSNHGLTSVDVAAPGDGIYSTVPGGEYGSKSGTSMATPHVAGAAALILSKYPDLTNEQVKARLIHSVDRAPSLEGKSVSGGRLNLARALVEDDIPPSAPAALHAVEVAADRVALAWTAPGDDGDEGTAARFELRYDTHPITDENSWRDARRVAAVPFPQAAGSEASASIPILPSAEDTTYYFAVRALDRVGNASPLTTGEATTPGVPMAFRDDMESGAVGWTLEPGWGIVERDGSKVLTDSPGADYGSRVNTSATTKPIDLSWLKSPKLSYSTRYEVENNFDSVFVEVTTDGGATWTQIDRLMGDSAWVRRTCDLSAYEGQTVQIRFRLATDADIEKDGIYLDDVMVSDDPV
ncbi:MAG: hypothetical protein FJX76_23635 [Armatimonadetes bacterium]|nr:hypothetical protein [Armatimonadota bacterium]